MDSSRQIQYISQRLKFQWRGQEIVLLGCQCNYLEFWLTRFWLKKGDFYVRQHSLQANVVSINFLAKLCTPTLTTMLRVMLTDKVCRIRIKRGIRLNTLLSCNIRQAVEFNTFTCRKVNICIFKHNISLLL